MTYPITIHFHNLEHSDAVETRIRERAEKLERFAHRIERLNVHVEVTRSMAQQHAKGQMYSVRLDAHIPGEEIVVSRDPGKTEDHEDLYKVIRDAFDTLTRRLSEHEDKVRDLHRIPTRG